MNLTPAFAHTIAITMGVIMTLHAVVRHSDPMYPSQRHLYGAGIAAAAGRRRVMRILRRLRLRRRRLSSSSSVVVIAVSLRDDMPCHRSFSSSSISHRKPGKE